MDYQLYVEDQQRPMGHEDLGLWVEGLTRPRRRNQYYQEKAVVQFVDGWDLLK
jgi:hypothetical protein